METLRKSSLTQRPAWKLPAHHVSRLRHSTKPGARGEKSARQSRTDCAQDSNNEEGITDATIAGKMLFARGSQSDQIPAQFDRHDTSGNRDADELLEELSREH